MDRRKLIVGGGAAAVVATVAAVAGQGLARAAASTIADVPTTTADHARLVLDQVDADLGLVNPAGLHDQLTQSYLACQASFAQRDQDPVVTYDLDAWMRQRMVDLCGTDSYIAAVTEIPQTRTLLGFSFLAYSQRQDATLPPVDPTMAVPTVLQNLEPDFLPVLLGQIDDKRQSTLAFAAALESSTAMLDQIVAENVQAPSGDGGPVQSVADDHSDFYIGTSIIAFICVIGWTVKNDRRFH